MFKIKKFPDLDTKKMERWPYDEDNDRVYRRVVGGFVPPGPQAGAVCIVGLEYSYRPPSHAKTPVAVEPHRRSDRG